MLSNVRGRRNRDGFLNLLVYRTDSRRRNSFQEIKKNGIIFTMYSRRVVAIGNLIDNINNRFKEDIITNREQILGSNHLKYTGLYLI